MHILFASLGVSVYSNRPVLYTSIYMLMCGLYGKACIYVDILTSMNIYIIQYSYVYGHLQKDGTPPHHHPQKNLGSDVKTDDM